MTNTVYQAYLGLGSNIEPEKHLCALLQHLETTFGDLELSTIYRTKAVGFEGDDFLNLVVGLKTDKTSSQLVDYLKQTEQALGRNHTLRGYSARTVDADLLLYEGTLLAHKDIERYPFVLYPLIELAPTLIHPIQQCTLYELGERLQLPRTDMFATTLAC
ncbi:2-amino-4-hydroxy-6-hydroxymethyldihydropteridine diphosphokinase [Thiofilum flexile]|uniref:2-amino-4-hydroxy-6- hydroxymethyldihydropteridine diphosphokinase n=1 Tax=Thiofilum flexile TaxID=125627 RepID=UPI00035D8260|nr:2-amino-4-hydroxy-6-hydroxymethyldihydropteridine diphosphokinase [Thiofilum flexile]